MHAVIRGRRGTRGAVSVVVAVALAVSAIGVVTDADPASAATAPGAPTAVNAVPGKGSATVSWMPPASNGGATITGYAVTPMVGYMTMATRVFPSTATSQTITGMTDGWTYRFKVAAINAAGTSTTSVASNATTPTATVKPAPTTFVHPGVLVSKADLDFVRAQVNARREPWRSALDNTLASYSSTATELRPTRYRFSSLTYKAAPVRVIQAGASESYLAAHPELGENVGGTEHTDDAQAAYTHALLWSYTGNIAYAKKSIEIMNAWSATLTQIKFDTPVRVDNGSPVFLNGKLQAGWGGSLFARSAEIIRHTGAGWASAEVTRFSTMLRNVYVPVVSTGWTNGANWIMTLAEATIGIAVFLGDRALFNAGVEMWREQAPTTVYMATDGPTPLPIAHINTATELKTYWFNPSTYVTGLQGETLRDISHMAFGLGAMSNAAQTAAIQGVDLFQEEQARIVAAYERNAGFVNQYLDRVDALGGAQPPSTWVPTGWPGPAGSFEVGGLGYRGGWEVAYAHFSEMKISMPNTWRLVTRLRPSQPLFHTTWETLSHAR